MPLPAGPWLNARVIYGSDQRQPFVNVLWFKPVATPSGDPWNVPAIIGSDLVAAIETPLKTCLCATSRIFGISCEYKHTTGVVYTSFTQFTSANGTVTDDEEPDFTAVVVRKHTATGGASHRGRWFIGAVPEVFTDTDTLTVTFVPQYEALAAAYADDYTNLGTVFEAQVYSKTLGAFTHIETTQVDVVLRTQRRRRLRRL